MSTERPAGAPPQSFAALRHPQYRSFLIGNSLVMMADNIEHVISYWMAFQKFHSPALAGFAVLRTSSSGTSWPASVNAADQRRARSSAASKVSFGNAANRFAIERTLARADFAFANGRPK